MNKSKIRVFFRGAAGYLNNRPLTWAANYNYILELSGLKTIKIMYL
jgi:hypothetical protein